MITTPTTGARNILVSKLNSNHKPERTVTFTFILVEIFCGFNHINALKGNVRKIMESLQENDAINIVYHA
jgi:hypothetical protein